MREIFLIRHAEAIYEPELPDAKRPLTPRGHLQASELARHVDDLGIEEIHSSPFERCLHTITPLSEKLGIAPTIVHDLRERAFTNVRVTDWAETWKTAWMDPDFSFHDGESGREAQARMHAAVDSVARGSSARSLAIASHGNVIALLLHRLDPAFGLERASAIRNPDIFRITFDGASLAWDEAFEFRALEAFATSFAASSGE